MAAEPEALKLGVVHGPNLNLLGGREPTVYGRTTLEELNRSIEGWAHDRGARVEIIQSNHEGRLLDWIQDRADGTAGYIVNAGALTHTSVGLRDALLGVDRPFIEVHLSNTFARETFRHRSLLADIALGVIVGLGPDGYRLALDGLIEYLRTRTASRDL